MKPNPTPACRGCYAPLIWARTPKGSLIPLDFDPDPKGNVVLEGSPPVARVLGLHEAREGLVLYMPHFKSCPEAEQFRRRHA